MERDNIVLDALREVAVEKFYGTGGVVDMERDNIVLDALREVAVEKFYGNGKRQYCAGRSKRGGSREVLR